MKDYLITFVRLLLGIDQAVGSGHLSSVSTHVQIVRLCKKNKFTKAFSFKTLKISNC